MALFIEHGDAPGSSSRWEELPYDALNRIFHFLTVGTVLTASRVCHAWQMSASHALFLTNKVLNLRLMDGMQVSSKQQFVKLLGIVLSLPSSYYRWEMFISPRRVAMPNYVLLDIARQTPKLRFVSLLSRFTLSLDKLAAMLHHWRKLEGFEALLHRTDAAGALKNLGTRCKKIRVLTLRTRIGIREAEIIVENFPCLVALRISRCMVTMESLNLILDVFKSLKLLNIKHSKFVDEENKRKNLTRAILDKAAGVGKFSYCGDPEACDECWTESFLF